MNSQSGYKSLEKLRRKITHDIEHQIQDLLKVRDTISNKVSIETREIEVPKLATSASK